jgi:pilus assembly protein FimV
LGGYVAGFRVIVAPNTRRALAASVALAFVPLSLLNPAAALTLGGERVVSFLGQPLRIDIPIEASFGEVWDASCFTLVSPSRRDGAAVLRQGRLDVSPDGQRVIVRTIAAIDEPALRVAIDIGCGVPLRREFTVLLDPAPVARPPLIVASDTPPAPQSALPPAAAAGSAPEAAAANAGRGASRPNASGSRNAGTASKESRSNVRSERVAKPRPKAEPRLVLKGADAPVDDAALAALAVPRLRISGDLPAWSIGDPNNPNSPAPTGTTLDELSAAIAKERRARLTATPIDEDLPARLEADLVVARKRLAEAQAQLSAAASNANGAASPSTSSATTSANSSTAKSDRAQDVEATSSFDWRDWIWIPAAIIVAGLLAFLWRQRRAQQAAASTKWSAVDTPTVVHGVPTGVVSAKQQSASAYDAGEATIASPPTISDVTVSSNTVAEARDRLESPLFHPSQTAASLDVSELSHITDEAQVYADLGRTNEAIEVLAHHIDHYVGDRPSPAPWLMLFELFRKANRRTDYDRLAPMFRKRFNGRLPEWENYGDEMALDDGLESFPHLIARIERDWGTPAVRSLLDEMLYDNRGGSRLGFSLSAYKDLLLLLQLHDQMASEGKLDTTRQGESAGANDDDGTPKWELALQPVAEQSKPISPIGSDDFDEFLNPKKD